MGVGAADLGMDMVDMGMDIVDVGMDMVGVQWRAGIFLNVSAHIAAALLFPLPSCLFVNLLIGGRPCRSDVDCPQNEFCYHKKHECTPLDARTRPLFRYGPRPVTTTHNAYLMGTATATIAAGKKKIKHANQGTARNAARMKNKNKGV